MRELSWGPSDPTAAALAHLERYRLFADRHAITSAHWRAYAAVLAAVLARGLVRGAGPPFARAVAAEARRVVHEWWIRRGAAAPPPLALPERHEGTPTVGAVIVFFRSEDVLVDCVRSVLVQTVRPQLVAVVANSPVPANTGRELEAMGAVVIGHEDTTNTGFAMACNRGAAALDVDYLWFVNPDVWCEPDCLEHLLRWATENLVLAPPCPAKRRSYLSPHVLLARELLLGRLMRLGEEPPPARPSCVAAVPAACLLVPRPAFLAAGGFDERYFLYGEDIDLCLRLAALGVRTAIVPQARATHRMGRGSGPPTHVEVALIKGLHARRSHYLLLERFRCERVARRYLIGLLAVLRLRSAIARALNRSVAERERAAYAWAQATLAGVAGPLGRTPTTRGGGERAQPGRRSRPRSTASGRAPLPPPPATAPATTPVRGSGPA